MYPNFSYDPIEDNRPQPSYDQWQSWMNANVNEEPDIYFMQKDQDLNQSFESFFKTNEKLLKHDKRLQKKYKKLKKHQPEVFQDESINLNQHKHKHKHHHKQEAEDDEKKDKLPEFYEPIVNLNMTKIEDYNKNKNSMMVPKP